VREHYIEMLASPIRQNAFQIGHVTVEPMPEVNARHALTCELLIADLLHDPRISESALLP
jgi:hypothetical protein